jgi:hypothetical protein
MSRIHREYLALYDAQMEGFYDKYARTEKDVYRDVKLYLDSADASSL